MTTALLLVINGCSSSKMVSTNPHGAPLLLNSHPQAPHV